MRKVPVVLLHVILINNKATFAMLVQIYLLYYILGQILNKYKV